MDSDSFALLISLDLKEVKNTENYSFRIVPVLSFKSHLFRSVFVWGGCSSLLASQPAIRERKEAEVMTKNFVHGPRARTDTTLQETDLGESAQLYPRV